MSRERELALQYFRNRAPDLWRWAEDGAVIVWNDGTTIAFREEIQEILLSMSRARRPPFNALVLMLAACRGLVPRSAQLLELCLEKPNPDRVPVASAASDIEDPVPPPRHELRQQLEGSLLELKRMSELPAALRANLRAKCSLAQVVFENVPAERSASGFEIREALASNLPVDELNHPPAHAEKEYILRMLQLVASGMKHHTLANLELRLNTGLEALPQPAPVELPPFAKARTLLNHLLQDPEYRMVGKAARELMAAVRLPRRLNQPDEISLGGVADITNRGPLDRLLLSELAHDDITLTARIALNEALYLKREPPAHAPSTSITLLIDSGIRQWGLPRVIAASTALAIVASDGTATHLRAWRAHGPKVLPIDLLSRGGLIDHLGELEPSAHPGEALPAFLAEAKKEKDTHSILVTHRDTLLDPEFRKALAGLNASLSYVATVDAEGRFALHAPPFSPRFTLCASQLNVEELLADAISSRSPDPRAVRVDLPAMLRLTKSPLLLPTGGGAEYWWQDPDRNWIVALTDRRLIEFKSTSFEAPKQGARVLGSRLPPGKTLWMERVKDAIHIVKVGTSQRPCRWIRIGDDGRTEVFDLCGGETALAAYRDGDILMIVRERDLFAYSLVTGELRDRTVHRLTWHRGRFFLSSGAYHHVFWDGHGIRFEQISLSRELASHPIVSIFDREGSKGPWLFNQVCQAISLDTGERIQIPLPIGHSSHQRSIHISRDGHRIYVSIPTLGWHNIFDLQRARADVMRDALPDLDRLDPSPELPQWNLHRSMDAIAITPRGEIALRTRQRGWRYLELHGGEMLKLLERPLTHQGPTPLHFSSVGAFQIPEQGCTLRTVVWPHGSRAWLDSRGLLHLRSHNPEIPEISLVLAEAEVAAWCSDSTTCGPSFFFPTPVTSDPWTVAASIEQFCIAP